MRAKQAVRAVKRLLRGHECLTNTNGVTICIDSNLKLGAHNPDHIIQPSVVKVDGCYVVRPAMIAEGLTADRTQGASLYGSFHPKMLFLETQDFLRLIITDYNIALGKDSMSSCFVVHDFPLLQPGEDPGVASFEYAPRRVCSTSSREFIPCVCGP